MRAFIFLLCLAPFLTGCGQTGPLYLPEEAPQSSSESAVITPAQEPTP